jgi:hypothetical protein
MSNGKARADDALSYESETTKPDRQSQQQEQRLGVTSPSRPPAAKETISDSIYPGGARLALSSLATRFRIKEPYIHAPMPSDTSFRVLELLPGQPKDLIRVRLQFADWTDPPEYEPISYAWGDPKDVLYCDCEGKRLSITRSLYSALLRFRMEDRSRILWADAVWYV